MKLWIKIFLSILLLSLTTLFISTNFIINKSHFANITREKERSLNEFTLLSLSISNSIDVNISSKETIKSIISRFKNYYAKKEIDLILYKKNGVNSDYLYNEFNSIDRESYLDLLNVSEDTKIAGVYTKNNRHYIMVSGYLKGVNDYVLIYARNIDAVYISRSESIRLSIGLALGLILALGFFSFLYSRWITKPLDSLHNGATSISTGNYQVRLKETKDEFNDVIVAFNNMASAVLNRTEELERQAYEKQIFIDDLSHEMNTPLTSIQGYADFLLHANASKEQKNKATFTIYKESKRMRDMFQKLMALTYARENKIERTDVNTFELINEVEATFYNQLNKKQISLQKDISLPTINVDRTLMHMFLSNLIKNSIQAMPDEGGEIRIVIFNNKEDNNENTIVEVTDTGSGIPQDKIMDVMKPFYRVDKSRSRKTGGAGLGLSICQSIASLHHANLVIESKPGTGTCIKLIL